jgi:hypothetical protein
LKRREHASEKCTVVGARAFIHTVPEYVSSKNSEGDAGDDSKKY